MQTGPARARQVESSTHDPDHRPLHLVVCPDDPDDCGHRLGLYAEHQPVHHDFGDLLSVCVDSRDPDRHGGGDLRLGPARCPGEEINVRRGALTRARVRGENNSNSSGKNIIRLLPSSLADFFWLIIPVIIKV